MTYKIVRFYQKGHKRVIMRGLTLEEAKAHCNHPESSYKTSSKRAYTRRVGPWFDGFYME